MKMQRLTPWLVLVPLSVVTGVFGQTSTMSDSQKIEYLMRQVQELQAQVKELKTTQQQNPVSTPSEAEVSTLGSSAEPPATFSEEQQLPQAAAPNIQWRGFGEVNYKVLDQRKPELGTFGFVPGSAGNFFTGDFDLFLTARINDRTSVLSEIVFGEGDAQTYDVDLERILLKYDHNDHLKTSFGRYHTGIGYYNTAFHSGKWLQTTADRPLIMEFARDGGLLPTQAVGVSVTGLIPSGRLGLNYLFEYGSSDTERRDIDGSGKGDDFNNGNHINLGLFVRPDAIPGLQVGTSFFHDEISHPEQGLEVRLGQTIVNAHVVYTGRKFEFLNEGFLVRHEHLDTREMHDTSSFYTQLSRQFRHAVRPYFRYQYINASPSIFPDVLLRHGPSVGVRYDFNAGLALKFQLDHTNRKGQEPLNGIQTQLAFTF
jgi:hypothetical protein